MQPATQVLLRGEPSARCLVPRAQAHLCSPSLDLPFPGVTVIPSLPLRGQVLSYGLEAE